MMTEPASSKSPSRIPKLCCSTGHADSRSPHSTRQCPLTGEAPSDRPVSDPDSTLGSPCEFWTRGVCCAERQLWAVEEVYDNRVIAASLLPYSGSHTPLHSYRSPPRPGSDSAQVAERTSTPSSVALFAVLISLNG